MAPITNTDMNANQDLVILNVEERESTEKKGGMIDYVNQLLKSGSINLRQKVIFFRIMATMVNASMTVLKSLSTLRKQEKNKNMQRFYDFMISRVESGYAFNEALRSYFGKFSDAECSIIEAGERTGKLNQGLLQVAEQTEKVDSITRKVKGALIYPMILIIGMVVVVVVIVTKVIPSIMQIFGEREALPAATQFLLGTSDFLQAYYPYIIVVIIAIVVGVILWKRTKSGHYYWDNMLLHLPIFGPLIQKVVLSKFARVFSNLIGSGVAIVEAIRIVSSAVGNEVYRQRILLLRQDVRNGMKMAESLEDDPLFPELLVAMLRVGEETAQIGNTVIKIAEFYDEEVDIAVGAIQKLIEPVILVAMGGVIAMIMMGVMQPMMNMAGAIGA